MVYVLLYEASADARHLPRNLPHSRAQQSCPVTLTLTLLLYEASADGQQCCWRHASGGPFPLWVEGSGEAQPQ